MADGDTLLAYLVNKRHIRQVEDAATDALANILNASDSAKGAFHDLIESNTKAKMQECIYFNTQKTEGFSRYDFVGYDSGLKKRVIGESKFDAALGKGQGGGYFSQLAKGPSVLLFVVPDYRIEHLWEEVCNDVQNWKPSGNLGETIVNGRIKVAKGEENRFLMMVSWSLLLNVIGQQARKDEQVIRSNVRQLKGLTEQMDKRAFLPLKDGELGTDIPRRLQDLIRLVDDVVNSWGIPGGWLSVGGFRATPRYDGYVRYFRLEGSNVEGWFGINYEHWAQKPSTPLWFGLQSSKNNREMHPDRMARIMTALHRDFQPVADGSIPISLKADADYHNSLFPSVVSQLTKIVDTINESSA